MPRWWNLGSHPWKLQLIHVADPGSIGEMRVCVCEVRERERERERKRERGGRGSWKRKERKERKKKTVFPSSLSFHSFPCSSTMSRTLQRAFVPESPTINVTSPSTPHLLTRSGKRPLIKEEEEEDVATAKQRMKILRKPTHRFHSFRSPLCSPLAGCRTTR